MKQRFLVFIILMIELSILLIFLSACSSKEKINDDEYTISLNDAISDLDMEGFARADSVIEFDFPKDHGPHNNYKLEWWYFTGNLFSADGRQFGYEFTIFRNAIKPSQSAIKSDLATNQIYFAHLAISDIKENKHYYFEKFSRNAAGLVNSSYNPLNISIEDWSITSNYENENYLSPNFVVSARDSNIALNLNLKPIKNVVLQGDRGRSVKSNDGKNASYYYSYTRIKTDGTISIDDTDYSVAGLSWMDREWSTSSLSRDQKGWDWFSIQLDDKSEIMYYRHRDSLANTNFAKGTYVLSDGQYFPLDRDDFVFTTLSEEKLSSGTIYPQKWNLRIPKYDIDIDIQTTIKEQEMKLLVKYYEGSIGIVGKKAQSEIRGLGFVELTGYVK